MLEHKLSGDIKDSYQRFLREAFYWGLIEDREPAQEKLKEVLQEMEGTRAKEHLDAIVRELREHPENYASGAAIRDLLDEHAKQLCDECNKKGESSVTSLEKNVGAYLVRFILHFDDWKDLTYTPNQVRVAAQLIDDFPVTQTMSGREAAAMYLKRIDSANLDGRKVA